MNLLACGLLKLLWIFITADTALALYEDQIKKFDWHTVQIGGLNIAELELNGFQPRLIVSTRENVIGSVCPKSGEILWRQILESGARGAIKLMQVASTIRNTDANDVNYSHDIDMLTVQGYAPALVRGWNTNTGYIQWEWSLMPLQNETARSAFWMYSSGKLYHVLPVWGSHLEITQYYANTGQVIGTTGRIDASWIDSDKCISNSVYYICLSSNKLISIDVTASTAEILTNINTLDKIPQRPFASVKGSVNIINIDNKLIGLTNDIHTCPQLTSNSYLFGYFENRYVVITADVENQILNINGYVWETCQPIEKLSNSIKYPEHYGLPTLKTFDCKQNRNNDGKGCLFIFDTEDDSILAVQQSKIRWSRSEALANIVATEFLDLPLDDSEGTLENEIKGTTVDILSAFLHRISSQMLHIKSIFLHVIGLGAKPTATQSAGLVRDSFGLHKMLVVLTKSGKIFGIDNISGKHHWQKYLRNVENFDSGEHMRLLIQRTTKYFPLSALCTIVAKHKLTGNGVLYSFNPITGEDSGNGLILLDYKMNQLTLLAESKSDFIKGILIMDLNGKLNVYPDYVKENARGMFLFTANKEEAVLKGFRILYEEEQLKAVLIWQIDFKSHDNSQRIISVAAKNPIEKVHSQGRVMADRSVMYKYINPNLVAVFTHSNDTTYKYVLHVHLIDAVSGSIVFSMMHRRVRPPLQVVHSENWLAYSYYNDKVRRTEITSIELYEGKTQTNSTKWSSLNSPPLPIIERQTYIMPTLITAMKETITERGISNKDVLIGVAKGSIIELPWSLLDPRRPLIATRADREEGVLPYIPELPIPSENIINYNQTIPRLHYIYTAPSGLESTCLVVAAGLDVFVTRVAPSKTFDLLKEDFDYFLIAIVLVVLTSSSFVAKYFAARKLLKQAWK